MNKTNIRRLIAVLLLIILSISVLNPATSFAFDVDESGLEEIHTDETVADIFEEEQSEEESTESEVILNEEETEETEVTEDIPDNEETEVSVEAIDGVTSSDDEIRETEEQTEVLSDSVYELPVRITEDNSVYEFSSEEALTLYQENDNTPHIIIDGAKNVTITFKNVSLNGNDRTGGIQIINGAEAVIHNVQAEQCKSELGGAIYVSGADSRLTLIGGTINNNTAEHGGAIYVDDGATFISDSDVVIKGNNAVSDNIMEDAFGGEIYLGNNTKASISNTTFTNNRVQSTKPEFGRSGNGGAIAIVNADSVTFGNNVRIGSDTRDDSNKAMRGAGIYYVSNKGTEEEQALKLGSGVSVKNNETYYTEDGQEKPYSRGAGGGLYIDSNSAVVLAGAVISHNYSMYNAGGILVNTNSSLYIRSGEVSHNEAKQTCGGVKIEKDSQLIMDDGSISYNKASMNGSGVHAAFSNIDKSTVILNGGEISYNESITGTTGRSAAGVYAYYLELNGGHIDHNILKRGSGSAVQAHTIVMTDGSISNNKVEEVVQSNYEYSLGTTIFAKKFFMSGGEISNNSYGKKTGNTDEYYISGTLWVGDTASDLEVEITGGTFKNNRSEAGGAIYSAAQETIIKGETQFISNTGVTGGAIYVKDLDSLKIGEGVSFDDNEADQAWLMTDEADIAMHERNIRTDKFTNGMRYGYNNYDINYEKGEIINGISEEYQVTFNTNGLDSEEEENLYGSQFTDGNKTRKITIKEGEKVTAPSDNPEQFGYEFAGWYTAGGDHKALTDAAGTYYRYDESKWGTKWNFDDPVTEDMTLYARWKPSTFYVKNATELKIALSSMRDEINIELLNDLRLTGRILALRFQKETVINISTSDEDEMRYITQTGEDYHFRLLSQGIDFALTFDYVTLDSESGYGGISLDGHSEFRLDGHGTSVITGMSEKASGGAIIIDQDAIVTVENITLEGNSTRADETSNAGRGGAIYAGGSTYLTVKNTTIRNNHATYGGGIYIVEDLSHLDMDNVIFEENKASYRGGGLFINGTNIINAVGEDGLGDIEFRQNEAAYYVNVLSDRHKEEFKGFAPRSRTYTKYNENEVFEIAYNNYDVNFGGEVYNVTYKANDGKGSAPSDKNNYGESSKVTVAEKGNLNREDYTFLGWNTDPEADTALYKAGDSFYIEADTVLYAIWAASGEEPGEEPGGEEPGEEPGGGKPGEEPGGGKPGEEPGGGKPGEEPGDQASGNDEDGKKATVTEKETKKTSSSPKTSDPANVILYMVALAACMIIIFAVRRRSKKEQI